MHILLISLCSFDSDLVVGPALLGLMHLSLLAPQQLSDKPATKTAKPPKKGSNVKTVINPIPGFDANVANMKASIADAGILPKLLPHMINSTSLLILAQACKLCASLALYFPNKPELARSGCFHSLFDLIQGVKTGVEVNDHIKYAALCAVVNITNGADANRNLAVELQGVKPLLITIRATDNQGMILESCKALTNISYCNSFTAAAMLSQAGDAVIITLLETTDIIRQSEIVHVALSLLANLCNSEVNQSHVGAAKGCVDLALRVIQFAREPYVVAAAANLLLALVLRNKGNKVGSIWICSMFADCVLTHVGVYMCVVGRGCVGSMRCGWNPATAEAVPATRTLPPGPRPHVHDGASLYDYHLHPAVRA